MTSNKTIISSLISSLILSIGFIASAYMLSNNAFNNKHTQGINRSHESISEAQLIELAKNINVLNHTVATLSSHLQGVQPYPPQYANDKDNALLLSNTLVESRWRLVTRDRANC